MQLQKIAEMPDAKQKMEMKRFMTALAQGNSYELPEERKQKEIEKASKRGQVSQIKGKNDQLSIRRSYDPEEYDDYLRFYLMNRKQKINAKPEEFPNIILSEVKSHYIPQKK